VLRPRVRSTPPADYGRYLRCARALALTAGDFVDPLAEFDTGS